MGDETGAQLDLLSGLSGVDPASRDPSPGAAAADGPGSDPQHQLAVPSPAPVSLPTGASSPAPAPTPLAPGTLLIVDTETTGLDPEQDQCLEVGAILFDVASRAVLAQQSFLLPVERNPAESINRIPAAVSCLNQPWRPALSYLQALLDATDVVVAHNASFDRQWFGRSPLPEISHPWLCTMEDIRWPSERQLRSRPSVRDLALAYEIPVWAAHRALTDCVYIAEVFRRCEDLESLLIAGLEPRRLMRACVSYHDRQLARDAGFRWNDPVKGSWTRRLSDRDIAALDFAVEPIEMGGMPESG
ncbi:3'-5' exonuclease [Synechococcus sp. MIT S1220]|uniref:3'-5' exonuclease n=1 Tax=Synechococcus sp. MIT S1220 TaxID=3082549 RepID=UPI0039B0249F